MLSCSKFVTTTDYAPRLRTRLAVKQQLIDDAITRGWAREVERQQATSARLDQLLRELGETPQGWPRGWTRRHAPRAGHECPHVAHRQSAGACAQRSVHIIESDLIKTRTRKGMKVARAGPAARKSPSSVRDRKLTSSHSPRRHPHQGRARGAVLRRPITAYPAIERARTAAPAEP